VVLGHVVVNRTFLWCSIGLWPRTYIFGGSDSANIAEIMLE
jgi:hypothetical protein